MKSSDKASNFDFKLTNSWIGYNSANDKTNVSEQMYVEGSQNIYKKLNGNLSVRPGQKRIGSANATLSAVSSQYVWNTSWGATLPVWVTNSTLQVNYNDVWYTLESGLTKTRYVFDKWYDQGEAKDLLLFVNGTSNLYQWTGGITDIVSGSNASGAVAVLDATPTNAGSGYTIGDVVTISTGGTGATAEVTGVGTGAILTAVIGGPAGTQFGGFNYQVGQILQLVGGNLGTGGSVRVASIGAFGSIATVTIETSGIGYAAGFYYTTTGGANTGAVIQVSTVSTSGSITKLNLLTPGSGYTTGTGKATTGGTGAGATVNINTIATGFITKTDSTVSFQQAGFSSAGVINVGGTEYTYQYRTGSALVGVSPNASGIVAGVGFQKVISFSDTPARGFNADFLKVINNQVYIGSYASRVCYISSNVSYINYVVPVPRLPGSPELLTLSASLKGIGVRQGKAYIGVGTGQFAIISFTDITVGSVLTQQTTVDIKPVAFLTAPYSHEMISNVGDNLVYLSQDQQVRTFGDFNNSFVSTYSSLSQEIATELMAEDFTGGTLRCIADFTYLSAPASGKTYLYQVRQAISANNEVINERLWHSPFIWNATAIDEIDGVIVAFSNANPQMYEVWDTEQWHDDSPSDENLPYSCVLALSYRTGNNRRQGLLSFDKNFSEGYLTEGTPLNLLINYNYGGVTNMVSTVVNSVALPATTFLPSIGSLGDSSLGDNPLGDELETGIDDEYAKFKVINSLGLINCFEYQPVYYSDTADARWEILASGTNWETEDEQQATYLINKQRNT